MKTLFFFALLALGGTDCVQPDYAAVCPLPLDPNMIAGAVLPPFPADPNVWTCEAGKYNRIGGYNDCEGDFPVEITYEGGTVDANQVTVTQDRQAHTWMVAADLPPGLHALQFRAVDSPQWRHALPAERFVTVVVEAAAPDNTGPVLY